MKKSLIAGAGIAALGLAVVPFAGVFADIRTMTDTINVTVNPECTFSKASDSDTPSAHGYSKTLAANSEVTTVGTTTMVVKCNDATGYKVSVNSDDKKPGDLVGPAKSGTGNETIPFATGALTKGTAGWNAATTATTVSGTTKTETAYLSAGATVLSSNTMTPAAGDTATIKYDVATSTNQAAGTYTGSITYTLTPNDANFSKE